MKKYLILAMMVAVTPLIAQKQKKKAKFPKETPSAQVIKKEEKNILLPSLPSSASLEDMAKKVEQKSGYIRNRNSIDTKGVLAFIKGVYVSKDHTFLLIEVKNKSSVDFVIAGEYFNTHSQKGGKENINLEERSYVPVWSKGLTKIPPKSWTKLVYAFDKFAIADQKVLEFNLKEAEGERDFSLFIPANYIINAKKIN